MVIMDMLCILSFFCPHNFLGLVAKNAYGYHCVVVLYFWRPGLLARFSDIIMHAISEKNGLNQMNQSEIDYPSSTTPSTMANGDLRLQCNICHYLCTVCLH
jgi:hypothetical protein